jgi:uncharacterized protein YidB (DUF937 family)
MNILESAVNTLSQQLNKGVDAESTLSALTSVLGQDGKGGLDLSGVVTKMTEQGGLADTVQSWLGDGGNAPINADTVRSLFGDERISEFASKLNIDTDAAASSLSSLLPEVMDKASQGGQLLDSVGGVGGLLDAAKSFLKS